MEPPATGKVLTDFKTAVKLDAFSLDSKSLVFDNMRHIIKLSGSSLGELYESESLPALQYFFV